MVKAGPIAISDCNSSGSPVRISIPKTEMRRQRIAWFSGRLPILAVRNTDRLFGLYPLMIIAIYLPHVEIALGTPLCLYLWVM